MIAQRQYLKNVNNLLKPFTYFDKNYNSHTNLAIYITEVEVSINGTVYVPLII